MFRSASLARAVFPAILCLTAAALAAATAPPPVTAEVRPDQALLYLIRPHGAAGGNVVTTFVYANEELIGAVKGDSYGTAYLAPGRYFIWGTGPGRVLEFVPGQTYYVRCALDTGITLMPEAEGMALMTSSPRFMPFVAEEHARAKQKGPAWFAKVRPKDYKWEPVAAAAPAPAPADVAGKLRVAAYSPVELELMEVVSSALTKGGSRVWFRVQKDAAVEGGVWLRAGTPVPGTLQLGQKGGGGGTGGVLEIEIPEVPAAGGAAIPVVGQVASAGTSRTRGATAAFALGGFLGASAVKGREAYHLPGTAATVFTRAETWTAPAAEIPAAAVPEAPPLAFAASLAAPIQFAPGKAKPPGPVTVALATAEAVADLALVEVDGWTIPTPPRALNGKTAAGQWLATFLGWDLVRHLPASKTPAPVRFTGHLADGREFTASGAMAWMPME